MDKESGKVLIIEEQNNKTVQIEEVHQTMNNQNLEVMNLTSKILFLMENKTIMEYIEQYTKEKDMDDAIFNQITISNYTRK